MRCLLTFLLAISATTAFAQDTTDGSAALGGVAISTSYNFSGPMTAKTEADLDLEEQGYRKAMYLKSAKECADLLDTIAKTCSVTNVSVSTQVTRQPGLQDQMYASASVTLQVDLK